MFKTVTLIDIAAAKTVAPVQAALNLEITVIEDTVARYPWAAVTTARMKGWLTYSFSEREFHHHRKMSSAGRGEIQALLHTGRKDYILGGHPLWQLARGGFQMAKKPYVIGGSCLMLAYFWCWIRRVPRAVSPELMRFHRREQLERLKKLLPWRGGLKR